MKPPNDLERQMIMWAQQQVFAGLALHAMINSGKYMGYLEQDLAMAAVRMGTAVANQFKPPKSEPRD